MDLVSLLVTLVILGLVFWLITAYLIPLLPDPFGKVVLIILVIIIILFLLNMIGVLPGRVSIR
jgi:hypothetical protein